MAKPIRAKHNKRKNRNETMRSRNFHRSLTRGNASEQHVITFYSASCCLRKWCKVFSNQSQRVLNQLKQKQSQINEFNFFSQKRLADLTRRTDFGSEKSVEIHVTLLFVSR